VEPTEGRKGTRAGPASTQTLAVTTSAAAMALLAVYYILWLYLPAFNTPHTALEGAARPTLSLKPTPGIARRLVVILMDGVSFEVAKALDELTPLRRAGVMRPLVVEFPSYTDPAITSFVTGLDPEDSGQRLNGKATSAPGIDTLALAAADAGAAVKIRSRGWNDFEELLRGRGPDASHSQVRFQTEVFAAALRGFPALEPLTGKEPSRELTIIYMVEGDKAAHYHGTTSPEFAEATHLAAAMIASYARLLDLEQDAIVVVSDHGHIQKGGHGGVEPEVLRSFFLAAGAFVRRGVLLGERPLRDVASTLSVLGGLRAPTTNLGRPMLDAMTLDDEQRSFVLAAPFEQAARMLCSLAPSPRCAAIDPLIARLKEADPTAHAEAEALLDAMSLDRRAAIRASWLERARARVGLAAVIALCLAALFAWKRREGAREALKLLVLPAVHGLIYCVGLYLQGYTASFSSITTQPAFYRDAAIASVFAVAIGLGVARGFRAGRIAPWVTLLGTAIPIAILAAWLGVDPKTVPPPTEGVLLLEIAPMILSAGVLAVLLARFPSPAPVVAPSG
jgi:hypothetical protein